MATGRISRDSSIQIQDSRSPEIGESFCHLNRSSLFLLEAKYPLRAVTGPGYSRSFDLSC